MLFFKKRKLGRLLKKVELLSQNRLTNPVADSVLKKEINLYKRIAYIYDALVTYPQYPYAREQALECYRLVADLGDVESMRMVGQRLMDKGKFWQTYVGTFFEVEQHKIYQKQLFVEAYSFLNTATGHDDAVAKRLLGVLYVNGWGVEADIDKGLQYIIASLDEANDWPRSSVIFEELGLNKPEFFTKLMAIKGGQ